MPLMGTKPNLPKMKIRSKENDDFVAIAKSEVLSSQLGRADKGESS